jgi:hypothetical protein
MTDLTPAVVVVNTDTGATTTIELDAGTTDTIDVVVPAGPTVVEIATGITSGTTVRVFVYTDEADLRPDADVVFWVPTPVTLGNPFAAVEGDCVLRTSENPVQGVNGIVGLWQGTPLEWEALPSLTADTVYFVKEPLA